MKPFITFLACCFLAAGALPGKEKPTKKGPSPAEPPPPPGLTAPSLELRFTAAEKQILQREVRSLSQKAALPPGLEKKAARGKPLPPGWQKKLAAGEVLPREVVEQAQPLPREIVIKLPAPPPGTILVALEGRILRLMEKTRQVLDVLDPLR